jgi:hypothetical protein
MPPESQTTSQAPGSKKSRLRKFQGVQALVTRREHVWYAVVKTSGKELLISDTDAWNFNIEIDLPVLVTLGRGKAYGRCRIDRRLRNNKQFKKVKKVC